MWRMPGNQDFHFQFVQVERFQSFQLLVRAVFVVLSADRQHGTFDIRYLMLNAPS